MKTWSSCTSCTRKSGIKNPACIVDCNHANSGKQYLEQIRIAKEVLHSKRHSNDINALVKGLMIESYIEDGNQKISEGTLRQEHHRRLPRLGKERKARAGAG